MCFLRLNANFRRLVHLDACASVAQPGKACVSVSVCVRVCEHMTPALGQLDDTAAAPDTLRRRHARYIPQIDWSESPLEASTDSSASESDRAVRSAASVVSVGSSYGTGNGAGRTALTDSMVSELVEQWSLRRPLQASVQNSSPARRHWSEARQVEVSYFIAPELFSNRDLNLRPGTRQVGCCLSCLQRHAENQQINIP